MQKNRLINEKYWSQFVNFNSETKKRARNGYRFEELVKSLLNLMYHEIEWKQTQMTHDGNKDFKAQDGEKIYWAECKNYKTKIDLKTLAATLVMAEIENVNSIFFFCYSEINNNTKTKLNSYSVSNNKNIFFFDGIVLDQLILKYKDEILPCFFPDLHKEMLHKDISSIVTQSIMLCYLERNPFFNGSPEFDIQNLTELQNLKLGEIISIHVVIINTNLNKSVNYSIELIFSKNVHDFEVVDINPKAQIEDKIVYDNIELPAGATRRKSFYFKLQSRKSYVELPRIICKEGNKKIREFKFSQIKTLKTKDTAFLGSNYITKREFICNACFNSKKLSVIYLYGGSGTGKSRMLAECSTRFIAQGYHIVKLVNSSHSEQATYTMLKELIFSLYGFTDELIEYVIQNSYEKLDNYNKDSTYKEIFRIIKTIYDNKRSLSQISSLEYTAIYEKMATEKYFFIVDDIQYWDNSAVSFLKEFYYYASVMQRKCNAIIAIAANTDVLYNQQIIEFLAELDSKGSDYESNIYSYNLTGFETLNQSYLFLKEILGTNDSFEDVEDMVSLSQRPKYIVEVANYLQDKKAVEIVSDKAIITDKDYLRTVLKQLPSSLKGILNERWKLYLENTTTKKNENDYEKVVSSILFLGIVSLQNNSFGIKHKETIESLHEYGFLKKKKGQKDTYVFEHDSIKYYFQDYYSNWFKTAVSYLGKFHFDLLKDNGLAFVYYIFENQNITSQEYYRYKDLELSGDVKYKVNERMFYLILKNGIANFFVIIQDILCNTREQFGEKKVEFFYNIFENMYDFNCERMTNEEYCIILMDYAENQIKLKSTEKSIKIYEKILERIKKKPFPRSQYMIAQIYNRYFVCGRVGGAIQQYIKKWDISMNLAYNNKFCDICIENYFDKAQSFFLDVNSIEKADKYLDYGCMAYEKHHPDGLKGQYLYRCVQLKFLRKDYTTLKNIIWEYDEIISNDSEIKFKLYFRIQFLIFKITLYLLGQYECSDFQIENMLEQLNMFQAMQNKMQLYRYFYLSGKYYCQKGNWEKTYLFYQKTFTNLEENKQTEEIIAQKKIIAQDMIINFRKRGFPFKKFDMSSFIAAIQDCYLREIIYSSDDHFGKLFNKYIPSAPISNEQTKEGYLLF